MQIFVPFPKPAHKMRLFAFIDQPGMNFHDLEIIYEIGHQGPRQLTSTRRHVIIHRVAILFARFTRAT